MYIIKDEENTYDDEEPVKKSRKAFHMPLPNEQDRYDNFGHVSEHVDNSGKGQYLLCLKGFIRINSKFLNAW